MTLDISGHPSLPSVRGKVVASPARKTSVLKVGEEERFYISTGC